MAMDGMSDERKQDWQEAVPEIQDQLDFLQSTAEEVSDTRSIDPDVRAEAISTAKSLAASLAEFGFATPAEHARAVLATLDHAGLPQPERLEQQVTALHESLAEALNE
jgi:hypothetical protein